MSRVINLLHFKKSKNDNIFNINVKRLILVYNEDINKTYIIFARRFVKKSFFNEESCFRKYNRLTKKLIL